MKIARIFILIIIGAILLPALALAVEVTFDPATAINGRVICSAPITIADLPPFSSTRGASRAAVRVYTKNQEVVRTGVTANKSGMIGDTDNKRTQEIRVWFADFGGGTAARDQYYNDAYWYGESGGYWFKVIDWNEDGANPNSVTGLRSLYRYGVYAGDPAVPSGGVDIPQTTVYFAIDINDAVSQIYKTKIYFDVIWE